MLQLAWSVCLGVAMASTAFAVNTTSTHFRIMAAGASVTFGVGSATGNSYRKDLEDLMTANGMTINYVGTKNHGNFTDNAVEATSGFVISQITAALNTAVPKLLPNLVLIDAGTNNCNNGGLVPDAGTNITNMINDVFAQSPGATVIMATVLVNSVAKQDACRADENKQISALAVKMQVAGKKLVLVDMRGPNGPLVTDLADGRHPNDAGYAKMANVWFKGVQEVVSKGLLSDAAATNSTSSPISSLAASAKTETPSAIGMVAGSTAAVAAPAAASASVLPASSGATTLRSLGIPSALSLAVFLGWFSIGHNLL